MFESWPKSTPAASSMELAAHELVAFGHAVVPMMPRGKSPLTAHGWKDATRCHEQVAKYWQRHPLANVGLATGSSTQLFVIDIDGPDGEVALARFGAMPVTVEALTGKGRHLYFSIPPQFQLRSLVGRLGAQIDTRGEGGLVVAPPSIHASGRTYRWADGHSPDEIEISVVPESIVSAMLALQGFRVQTARATDLAKFAGAGRRDRVALERFRAWFKTVDRHLGEGMRNATAYRIACRALEAMSFSDAQNTLAAWNQLNRPPMSSGELVSVMRSAARSCRAGVMS